MDDSKIKDVWIEIYDNGRWIRNFGSEHFNNIKIEIVDKDLGQVHYYWGGDEDGWLPIPYRIMTQSEYNVETSILTPEEMLDLPLVDHTETESKTIRDYLISLLSTLWHEGECFSGKRPFGNSGWQYDLYKPLIISGVIDGELDEEGGVDFLSGSERDKADELIGSLILKLTNK